MCSDKYFKKILANERETLSARNMSQSVISLLAFCGVYRPLTSRGTQDGLPTVTPLTVTLLTVTLLIITLLTVTCLRPGNSTFRVFLG